MGNVEWDIPGVHAKHDMQQLQVVGPLLQRSFICSYKLRQVVVVLVHHGKDAEHLLICGSLPDNLLTNLLRSTKI